MSQIQTISLNEHWNTLIDTLLKSGRYASVNEIMSESLRLLEEKEVNASLQALRNALIEGEESGDAGELDMEKIRIEAKKAAKLS